jgi:hypothetical protein
MKYIVMQRNLGDIIQEVPIIFPTCLVHKHVAQALLKLPGNSYQFLNRVASAGEITFGSIWCGGDSETLKISSRPQDEALISSIDYNCGYEPYWIL